MSEFFAGPDTPEQFEAVETREFEIEQDNDRIDRTPSRNRPNQVLQCFNAIPRNDDVVLQMTVS
jgi:hypothetical protein